MSTYAIPEKEYSDLLAALYNSSHALNLALSSNDMGNESGAVVQMTRDLLAYWAEKFDRIGLLTPDQDIGQPQGQDTTQQDQQ